MQNLFNTLENILSQDERFVTNEGQLLRNAVFEAAMKMDEALLKLLLDNEETRKNFFKDIEVAGNKTLVFDKIGFGWVINNKAFLPDSYTRYKNKIGLVDETGRFISNSGYVELVFPYKDCVLVGGQTKEEQKRNEIFFNKRLAPDEVDRLLAPKVMVNAKRYTKDGVEEITSFAKDDNLIIKGNNLLAIKSLLSRYEGKIKCIYIDPPYNTGNDGFGYNDKFTTSAWLNFMRDRLIIAKKLLSKDGLIFVSIDISRENANGRVGTSGFPYLNVLMDEIFGRKNYIATLIWKKKKQPSYLSRVAGLVEPILVYAKNESNISKLQIGQQSDNTTRIDNASNPEKQMHILKGIRYMGDKNCIIRKGVYRNKTMSTEFLQDVIVKNGRTVNEFDAIAKYRTKSSEIKRFCEEDLLYITSNNSFRRFKTEEEKQSGKSITDLLLDWGQNQDATSELRKLFNISDDSKVFENPKPELLISKILSISSKPNDLILDFFLGSGTTAAVAHKMGRQYIGIEQMDYIDDIIIKRLQKVIGGEQTGISQSVNWQGGGSFVYCELAQLNEKYVEAVQKATTDAEVTKILQEVLATGFISDKVNPKLIDTDADDYKELSLDEKKKFVMEVLDSNMLYVNYSDIDDKEFNISEADKAFTKSFYGEE